MRAKRYPLKLSVVADSQQALPKDLDEAVAALRADKVFPAGFGDAFVDYYAPHEGSRTRALP
jgi:glutamine synthetase